MQRADISFLPYVSSHGTGTPLGDPIETGALRKAVAQPLGGSPTPQVFTVGAVKSLTGHLEGTAGLAGLMLCMLKLASLTPALSALATCRSRSRVRTSYGHSVL